MLGSHRLRIGNAIRIARRITPAHMNGRTPPNAVAVDSFGSSGHSTKMFIPTGAG